MKTRGTTATAGEFVDELLSLLRMRAIGDTPTFESDLRARLIEEVGRLIGAGRHGIMNDWNFEILLRDLMVRQCGACRSYRAPPIRCWHRYHGLLSCRRLASGDGWGAG